MNNISKAMAMALITMMVVCAISIPCEDTSAVGIEEPTTTGNWADYADTTWYSDSSATEYTIDTAAELAGLAKLVNEGTANFNNKTITITKSIDLSGNEWTPIGYKAGESCSFLGTFVGAVENEDKSITYNTISNITVKPNTNYDYLGLFGYLYGGAEKVRLENVWVESDSGSAGALAGYMPGVTDKILDCHVNNATLKSSGGAVGGLIGTTYNIKGGIEGCQVNNASITGESVHTGGIVGTSFQGSVSDCRVTGSEIRSNGAWAYGTSAGGIIGFGYSNTENPIRYSITGCDVQDTDILSESSSNGGILGQNRGQVVISDCVYSESSITGRYVGGIIGLTTSESSQTEIELCHVDTVMYSGLYVAGIAGYKSSGQCTISNSYVSGMTVTGDGTARHTTPEGATSTNVTYLGDGGFDGWIDDGTNHAIIAAKDTDGGILYYYGNLQDFQEGNQDAKSAELIDGAVFDDSCTVGITLTFTGTATVPSDVVLTFEDTSYIAGNGTFTVDGTVVLPTEPDSGIGVKFDGSGILQINGTSYNTDMTAPSEDVAWYYTTEGDSYEIGTEAQLRGLARLVNDYAIDFSGKTITLTADIELTQPWTPIGHHINKYGVKNVNEFNGTFEGNEKTISNLNVNAPDQEGVGLFGSICTGSISDLTIENATVHGMNYVGALVGWYGDSKATGTLKESIVNCHVTGDVKISGNYMVGGLVGRSTGGLENCSVVGNTGSTVSGEVRTDISEGAADNIGGLVSYIESPTGTSATISECLVQGISVTGSIKVGGMFGAICDSAGLKNCTVSDITVTSIASADLISDEAAKTTACIGGLVGSTNATGDDSISITGAEIKGVTLQPVDGIVAGYIFGAERTNSGVKSNTATVSSCTVSSDCTGATTDTPGGVTVEHTVTFVVGSASYETKVVDGETVDPLSVLPSLPDGCEYDFGDWNADKPVESSITVEVSATITNLEVEIDVTAEGQEATLKAKVITDVEYDNVMFIWVAGNFEDFQDDSDVLWTEQTYTTSVPGTYTVIVGIGITVGGLEVSGIDHATTKFTFATPEEPVQETTTVTELDDGTIIEETTRSDGTSTTTTTKPATETSSGNTVQTVVVEDVDKTGTSTTTASTTVTAKNEDGVTEADITTAFDDMDETTGSTDAQKTLIIDVKASKAESVLISKDGIQTIKNNTASLTVQFDAGSVTLDTETVSGFADNQDNVTISASAAMTEDVSDAQKDVLDGAEYIRVTAETPVDDIHELRGMALISMYYDLPKGIDAEDVRAFYVDESGILHVMTTSYDAVNKIVSFYTDHFSYYMIGDVSMITSPVVPDEPEQNIPPISDDDTPLPPTYVVKEGESSDDTTGVVACAAAAVVAAMMAVLLIFERRRN